MIPNAVPISEAIVDSQDIEVTEFRLGQEEDWIVEWKMIDTEGDEPLPTDRYFATTETPPFLSRSRTGWYIHPDPLHNLSRRMILPTVSLLIISLFIHAIEPGLVEQGIINNTIAGSISIGPLEYPRLLFFTFPIFLIPLLFRTIANFRDMARQKFINSRPYENPEMEIEVSRESTKLSISELPNNLSPIRARIQVGIAVPERSSILNSLGRNEHGQPSPGLSTKLPDKRVASGDEAGIGVGEATPMQLTTRRSVILEPMRIMQSGDWADISKINNTVGSTQLLVCPPDWPGTIYSPLIAVHWELLLEFEDSTGRRIQWVSPILMPQSENRTTIDIAPIRSGRAELSNY